MGSAGWEAPTGPTPHAFSTAWCLMPHPEKRHKGGEDAAFGSASAIGVVSDRDRSRNLRYYLELFCARFWDHLADGSFLSLSLSLVFGRRTALVAGRRGASTLAFTPKR